MPLLLNFKAGSNAEFLASIPQYEQFASELAEQGVDVIMLTAPRRSCCLVRRRRRR